MNNYLKAEAISFIDLYNEECSVFLDDREGEYTDKAGIRYVYPGVKPEEVNIDGKERH